MTGLSIAVGIMGFLAIMVWLTVRFVRNKLT